MRSFLSLVPFVGSLVLLSDATPFSQPSVTFAPLGNVGPESAQNLVVEYSGDVDGELTITYGSCADALISKAKQLIGSTHVGGHPRAVRHADHEDYRPTKFVWLTPETMSDGCLHAFLDGELIGRSEELAVTKRMARRSEKKSFADVAGDDSMWFNGVAYLQQKQPNETFVAAAKSKSFGILGGGMSGLASSVSLRASPALTLSNPGTDLSPLTTAVDAGLCWYSQLEDLGVV